MVFRTLEFANAVGNAPRHSGETFAVRDSARTMWKACFTHLHACR